MRTASAKPSFTTCHAVGPPTGEWLGPEKSAPGDHAQPRSRAGSPKASPDGTEIEHLRHIAGIGNSAPIWILLGFSVIHLVEHTIVGHLHFGEETHYDVMISKVASYSAFGEIGRAHV